jgi:hypothetical protein
MSRHFFDFFGGSSGFALQTQRPALTSARAGREGLLHGHLLLVIDVAEDRQARRGRRDPVTAQGDGGGHT